VAIAYPEFRNARCTRFRYRYSECQRCLDACPHEAIALADDGARIDETRCRNCGLCIAACHTGAWASESFKPIDLLRQAIKQPAFSVACAPSGLAADAIVPCLGALGAAFIAYLGKRRIPLTLLGSSHCSQCEHGAKGAAALASHLDAAERLREAAQEVDKDWIQPQLTDAAPIRSPEKPTMGRRQLFRRLIGRGVEAVAAAPAPAQQVVPEKAIRAGAYASTEERELLQIVCARKDGQPTSLAWHEALPLMQLILKSGCTNCEACFRACPTGALQIVENPGEWALAFQTDRCVACEVCLEVCQPRVLDAQARFDARPEQPARVLHSLVKQRCARCERFFVSPQPREKCPICEDDEDAFAQIFG
jgi:ferredoxin